MSLKTRLLIFFAVLALLGVVVLYVLEFQWFQNYLDLRPMLLGSLVVGILLGIFLGFRFQKSSDDLAEIMQIWSACVILPLFLMPLFASLANRLFAKQAIEQIQVEFWEEKAYIQSRYGILKGEKLDKTGYFVFVVKDGEILRLQSKTPRFPNAKKGDKVNLPLRKGLFGTDFVDWPD